MSTLTPRPHPNEKGQSLIEFALMGVFLVILLMGVLDLGRAYFTYLALKDAAAEGAYFASAFPQCEYSNVYVGCAQANNIRYRVQNSSPAGLVDWRGNQTNIDVIEPPLPLAPGKLITVTVNYRYQMLTPFVGAIAGGQALTLSATSTAVIVRVLNCNANPCQ